MPLEMKRSMDDQMTFTSYQARLDWVRLRQEQTAGIRLASAVMATSKGLANMDLGNLNKEETIDEDQEVDRILAAIQRRKGKGKGQQPGGGAGKGGPFSGNCSIATGLATGSLNAQLCRRRRRRGWRGAKAR